jgi:hypothetical protein
LNWYRKAKKVICVDGEDLGRLNLLIEKMIKGNHNWTPEDLQLQQAYPEAIEALLKKHLDTSL